MFHQDIGITKSEGILSFGANGVVNEMNRDNNGFVIDFYESDKTKRYFWLSEYYI